MAEVKFTKNELRDQQGRLGQLERYLPTLQLKKAMLQIQAQEVKEEIHQLQIEWEKQIAKVEEFALLLGQYVGIDSLKIAQIDEISKRYENIAGVEIPIFEAVTFEPINYALFETPAWLDSAVAKVRQLVEVKVKINITLEKKAAIEKELREVSIRVNLFEKVLIPRALGNIKKIKVFLSDQQLAAVARAKVAKKKIMAHQALRQS